MWRPPVGRSVGAAGVSALAASFALAWCAASATAGAVTAGPSSTTTAVNPGGPQRCQTPAGGATGRSTPPTGLVAYDIYSPAQGMYPFAPDVFSDKSVSGVDLEIGWQDLEPSAPPAPVQWAVLDCLFDQAAAAHKFVVLTLHPGFATPSWALPSGEWFMSSFAYHQQKTPRPLPVPWDATYLGEWSTFLGQVSARYETVPAFRMIAAAGPTSVSAEMSLPNLPGGTSCIKHPGNYNRCDIGATAPPPAGTSPPAPWPPSADGSDIAIFEALPYTPGALESAWTSVFATYAHDFPDQYISLALSQGLPIGSGSTSDLTQYAATPLEIIHAGSMYKSQFVVQANGLGPECCHQPPGSFVAANCGTVVTGFQTTSPPIQLKRDPDLESYLAGALTAAEQAGVGFVEIYEPDDILVAQPTPGDPDPPVNTSTAPLLAATMKSPAKLPASARCAGLNGRLRLEATPEGRKGPVTLTATTTMHLADLDFDPDGYDFRAAITISQGSNVYRSCSTGRVCQVTIARASGRNVTGTFTADIGYPGEVPIVSAATTVK